MVAGREDLLESVRTQLEAAGFQVSDKCDLRPVSFDIVARRDRELLMVKVLGNVDGISDAVAHEIKLLCKFLEARPLLVGLRSGAGQLEEGVVYARHDIPIVTPGTLAAYLHQEAAPMVFAAPGGFYVRIDGDALRRARDELRLSLGALAQQAGVSRRAIQMYEEGMNASIEAAMRLEQFLNAELIRPLSPFETFGPRQSVREEAPPAPPPPPENPTEAMILKLLEGVGYEVRATRRSPFDALSIDGSTGSRRDAGPILTGMGQDSPQLRRRATIVASISRVTGRPGFFVVERTTRTQLGGTPVVSREELANLRDPQRILDLILERRGRQAEPQ